MGSKRAVAQRRAAEPEGEDLVQRLRPDLERLGVAPERIDAVARRLGPALATLSPEQYAAVLAGVVAAAQRGRDAGAAAAVDAVAGADIQRLMEGFRDEVQKLDEGLRMLSAYVTGLRQRTRRSSSDTLH